MSTLDLPHRRISSQQLRQALLEFIRSGALRPEAAGEAPLHVEADTPLFEEGLLDSLSILHLIAAVEHFTGRPVPDEQVLMKHFRTVSAIADTFATSAENL